MDLFLIVLLIIIALGFLATIFYFRSELKALREGSKNDQSFLLLQNQVNEMSRVLDTKLSESMRHLQFQSSESAKIIRDVTERLTKLDETNKQVVNFADQLQNLQDILKNPKQRGILGEYYLEAVLKNVLPPASYKLQHPLGKDNQGRDLIVDAVIFIKDKIIPIDSKFSLENYNRLMGERDANEREKLEKAFKLDLKNRIDETSKYIQPNLGTMDFAFMFIPAEAIYYDLLVAERGVGVNTRDLIEYAFKDKRVIIVSPTSFFAYLQTVLQGMRALQIEESAKEIIKRVELLSKHLLSYDMYMKKIGDNLGTTVNMYNQAYLEFGKIDKDVLKITGAVAGIQPVSLDKPRQTHE